MAIWKRTRNKSLDHCREFIYLDEVSVVSLLASLQGEIKDTVTKTLARTRDRSIGASFGVGKTGAKVDSRLGASGSSTDEVVRHSVIQSRFGDLRRCEIEVIRNEVSRTMRKSRKKFHSLRDLEDALPRLRKAKVAVPLCDIRRGDVIEMDVEVEADQLFKLITAGTTFLDFISGREDLFGASARELREVEPMIEVLKELFVGLVPVRGVATSHSVIEVDGEQYVVAKELLSEDMRARARRLKLAGFAENDAFWRDLRRTLFSCSTFTVYARTEGPPLTEPWSPVKIVELLLKSLSPELSDAVVLALQQLDLNNASGSEAFDVRVTAQSQLEGFAAEFQEISGSSPDPTSVNQAVKEAVPVLASATTIEDQRHAFEPVARAVAGPETNRDRLLEIRSKWMNLPSMTETSTAPLPPQETKPDMPDVELEVAIVALYW